MPGVNIKCGNTACTNPTNTAATHKHAHGLVSQTWTVPAYGPTMDSAPFPSPCPNDGTPCPAISVKCNTCGWTKTYPA